MKHIILDTNFLLIPAQFGVDIFSEIKRIMTDPYELCIIDKTLYELKKVQDQASGSDRAAALLAEQFVKKKKLKALKTEKNLNVDKLIVEAANNPEYLVATQDMALKRELKLNGVKLIVLRQKKYLVFE